MDFRIIGKVAEGRVRVVNSDGRKGVIVYLHGLEIRAWQFRVKFGQGVWEVNG